ncbi:MAG: formate C-acetyltransferase/glycerol dehydratase family glycyl radical enzyme [Sulfolobales archaeon]|nr:formate C-acetyltransferase/glycerol dehydratase family glycyl radical enzyme [Sulfolobales archaeon]MDW7969847.1 formate C-acetyltransferase/glycerol dehydratase family glycyl radical enzyme [Sulfolobales archaeon]
MNSYRLARLVDEFYNEIMRFKPSLCHERAVIFTESYKGSEGLPQVIRRAKAVKEVLEKMSIYILKGELIVGNQASRPRAAPLFPEFSVSFLINELEEIPKRPFDSFTVDDHVRNAVREISGYWLGKTHEDRVKYLTSLVLPDEVLRAFDIDSFVLNDVIYAGVRKSSGDGHIIPNYSNLLKLGFPGILKKVEDEISKLDLAKSEAFKKRLFLEAVKIVYEGVLNFVERYSILAKEMADVEYDDDWRSELITISEVCSSLLSGPPKTFREALQLIWFAHLILQIESNGHSVSLGRLDQYLYQFYKDDILRGKISREDALELIKCFLIKMNTLNKVRPWSETRYKTGYPLFMTITLGGQTREGFDATNELTYLFLEALSEVKLPQPTIILRVHSRTPEKLLIHATKALIKHGGGLPAFFSDEVVIPALMNIGIRLEDAREYAIAGCSEAIIPGKSLSFTGGDCYFNLLKILEITLNEGCNPRNGLRLFRTSKMMSEIKSIDEFIDEFRKQLTFYAKFIVPLTSVTSAIDADLNPTPFASSLIDHRIEYGADISEGGGPNNEYSHTIIQGHGIANVANALYVIEELVFNRGLLTLEEFRDVLLSNWEGDKGRELRRLAISLPKYGNDMDCVDKYVTIISRMFYDEIMKYRPLRGAVFGLSLQGLTANVPEGEVTGATPDGRFAGEALADNASPHPGTDRTGITATLKSVSKIDHSLFVNGNILNIRFHPSALTDAFGSVEDAKLIRFVKMLTTYLIDLKGFQVQFNTVSAEILRAAQKEPLKYANLIVKVAGYSAYFTSLDKKLQDQIIFRTEHII